MQNPINASSFLADPQPATTTALGTAHTQHSFESTLHLVLTSPHPSESNLKEGAWLYNRIVGDCRAAGLLFDGEKAKRGIIPSFPIIKEDPAGNNGAQWYDESTYDHSIDPEDDGDDDDDVIRARPRPFPLHRLFAALYSYVPTTAGRNNIIHIVLHFLFPPSSETAFGHSLAAILERARSTYKPSTRHTTFIRLSHLAQEILTTFFLPLKAAGHRTSPTSALITATSRSEPNIQDTPNRLASLRTLVLKRDGNRCVVTNLLDKNHVSRREAAVKTKATHIIPHHLNSTEHKCIAWRILNMFDPDIGASLEDAAIDTPHNALLLATEIHDRFNALECYFEKVPDGEPNTYTFHTTRCSHELPPGFGSASMRLTFRNQEHDLARSALPNGRLLRLHRACCLMLEMAKAGEYVESLLDDVKRVDEFGTLKEDGSSSLEIWMAVKGFKDFATDGVEWAIAQ